MLALSAGHAATFNIADGDVAGLIAAIQTANANGQANTINLAPNGSYILTALAEFPVEYGAPGAVGLPVVRSVLTINGNGATIQRSNAPGTRQFTVLAVSGKTAVCGSNDGCCLADLTLNGTTIMGGRGRRPASGRRYGVGPRQHDYSKRGRDWQLLRQPDHID
jgi:hypothetical protein